MTDEELGPVRGRSGAWFFFSILTTQVNHGERGEMRNVLEALAMCASTAMAVSSIPHGGWFCASQFTLCACVLTGFSISLYARSTP